MRIGSTAKDLNLVGLALQSLGLALLRSGRSTASQLSDMKSSQKLSLQSEKEEKISEEWYVW